MPVGDSKISGANRLIKVDNLAHEIVVVKIADFLKTQKAGDDSDILTAQAKYEQAYFKSHDSTFVITDFGFNHRAASEDFPSRTYFLWKKENAPDKPWGVQYLCATVVNDKVVVISIIPLNQEAEMTILTHIKHIAGSFDILSSELCKSLQ
jgi:hypothetical protein